MKTYIQPQTTEEQVVVNSICLTLSSKGANSELEVLTPERDEETEWEEI